jgi:hypothetical protein
VEKLPKMHQQTSFAHFRSKQKMGNFPPPPISAAFHHNFFPAGSLLILPQQGLYVNDLNEGAHTVRSTADANT